LAYTWKIKFNETGKTPAFCNVLPELNHNEMAGFGGEGGAKKLSEKFFIIILKDKKDHPRILRRIEALEDILKSVGVDFEVAELQGKNEPEKIFSSLTLADWTAYYLAYKYGSDPEAVPLVERFKKML
jgi:glucose/mannose-6-phosphate isomerase